MIALGRISEETKGPTGLNDENGVIRQPDAFI